MTENLMQNLKTEAFANRIPLWKIAKQIGITNSTLSVWLRSYDPDHYERISDAIDRLKGEDNG